MPMSRFVTSCLLILAFAAFVGCPRSQQAASTTGGQADGPAPAALASQDRSAIPDDFLWDLSPLFENEAHVEAAFAEVTLKRERLGSCAGTLSDPVRLTECLGLYFEARLETNRLTLYASLVHSTAQSLSEAQALEDRALLAMNDLMGVAATLRGEILALDEGVYSEPHPGAAELVVYRPYIERMRRRAVHVLGAEAERVLTLAGDNQWAEIDLNELPSDHERSFGALMSELPLPEVTDESGRLVALTLSNYGSLRGSSERRVRREAVEGLFGSLRALDGTFASMLTGQARHTVFLARARGYESALDAYLDRDEVDPAIYRNLVQTVEQNAAPLHRYTALRRQLMELDELHIYDLYVPLVPAVELDYPYDEARTLITEALEPLGPDYVAMLGGAMEPRSGWLDLYPHQGKRSGAFSASLFGEHPYVFMNYMGSLGDVSTLAHEYGHALHSHLSMSVQPYVTSGYVPVIAETASTVNEVLVIRHLIDEASNDDERLYLLGRLVEMIRTTIYRQALFASFELAVHEAIERGEPTTVEQLDALYSGLLRRYYGDALTLGPNDGMEWAYVPHFYYKFYLYSYAVGLCSGIALGDRVREGGEAEREAYLDMLRGGSSRPPLELLQAAGADPSDPALIRAATDLLDDSLTQMEEILARRASAAGTD